MRLTNKGSVLIEGAIALGLVTLLLVTQIELIRRVWTSVVLQLIAFESVRSKVLGFEPRLASRDVNPLVNRLPDWVDGKLGYLNLEKHEYTVASSDEAITKYHIKYSSLVHLDGLDGVKKMTYEVTEKCRFPFSIR